MILMLSINFKKKFGSTYHLSRSKSKRNLNEPSTSSKYGQVLMQGTLDPILSSSMFEQATTQSKNCQSVNNPHSSLIVDQSNSQVRPTQTVHDQTILRQLMPISLPDFTIIQFNHSFIIEIDQNKSVTPVSHTSPQPM